MIEQTNKTWYIARRGELLAEQFLLDLSPNYLSPMQDTGIGIDYMAFFSRDDGTVVVIAVEVKATQQEVKGRYSIPSPQALRLLKLNIPALILVVDVKENIIYFNWIKDAIPVEQQAALTGTNACRIILRASTPDERAKLRQEIFQ
jgi:hypothetical protein